MIKIINFIAFLALINALVSCVKAPSKEEAKTARSRAALDRINSSKSSADSITKELDNDQ